MPERPDSHKVRLQLTEAQYAALKRAAEASSVDVAVLIRRVLAEHVEGFPGGRFSDAGDVSAQEEAAPEVRGADSNYCHCKSQPTNF